MIPVMLWIFQLYDKGWNWQYAALFGSMLGATDAVAIIGTMKASKPIEQQVTLSQVLQRQIAGILNACLHAFFEWSYDQSCGDTQQHTAQPRFPCRANIAYHAQEGSQQSASRTGI